MSKFKSESDVKSIIVRDDEPRLGQGISFRGFEFDIGEDSWRLSKDVIVYVSFLRDLEVKLGRDVLETLLYFAEGYSASYTQRMAVALKQFFKVAGSPIISSSAILEFKVKEDKGKERYLLLIRTFLRQMKYLQLDSEVPNDIFELMDQWRLKGGERGVPVLSLCPISGPFSDIEFEAIGTQAAHAYAEGRITAFEYSLILLFKSTGRRPDQISGLKVKDFVLSKKYTSKYIYAIHIPRVKQRSVKFRSSFRIFGLVETVGQVLTQHVKDLVSNVESKKERNLSQKEKEELPLFITPRKFKEISNISDDGLIFYLESEMSHMRTQWLREILENAVDKLNIISERTGEPLRANPYRFRYTLGTRAAREGAGTITIATLLDHTDTQHTGVYVENVPEFAIEIGKVMNQSLMQYASAFAGKIVADEDAMLKEKPDATRIPCHEKECNVGSCGTNSFCTDYAPIACYLCPKFHPWANAPHHLILEWLLEERNKLKNESADMAVVTINDRAIIAVCQVIDKCKEFNANV
ncbi:TPA: site-specific integrase [Klebsiella pneumoniae]